MTSYMVSKKTMELNPKHSIVSKLQEKFEGNANDPTVKDLVWLIFETAMLTSGFSLDDPSVYSNRIYKLVKLGLNIYEDDEEEAADEEENDKGDDDEDLPPLVKMTRMMMMKIC